MTILRIFEAVLIGLHVCKVAGASLPECTCRYIMIDEANNTAVPGVTYDLKKDIDSCDENGRIECRTKCEANMTDSIDHGGFGITIVVNSFHERGCFYLQVVQNKF
ncbi:Uncharacterised protein r2_g2126 [Pycnogonum litorale]